MSRAALTRRLDALEAPSSLKTIQSWAAAMLGMTPRYFRTRFCDHLRPALPIIESRGASGRRRILLRRSDVEALIESMTVRPGGIRPEKGASVLVQKATRDGP